MTNIIKCKLWQLLGALLKSFVVFGKGVRRMFIAIAPIAKAVGRLGFSLVLVKPYRIHLSLKMRFNARFSGAKNRFLLPLTSKYAVHAAFATVVLLVAFVSVRAHGATIVTARPSLLSAVLQRDVDEEIVETAITAPRTYHREGIGGISPLDVAVTTTTDDVAATQGNSSLVKPLFAGTALGDRPREDVAYHYVEGGETVSTIAERYGISVNTILWENTMGPNDFIRPGQKLTILPMTGVAHRIAKGETLASIATTFESDIEKIVDYNQLADASAISVNDVVLIPDGRVPPPAPAPSPTSRLAYADAPYSGSAPADAPASNGRFQWPTVFRKINQYFTYRHGGIDIDGDYSTPIYAAQTGRVVQAGWRGGYGIAVVLDHGNGYATLYGHASKLFVKPGQYVTKGQSLGMVGSTGYSTGTHVHFEIRINGRSVNPLSYL